MILATVPAPPLNTPERPSGNQLGHHATLPGTWLGGIVTTARRPCALLAGAVPRSDPMPGCQPAPGATGTPAGGPGPGWRRRARSRSPGAATTTASGCLPRTARPACSRSRGRCRRGSISAERCVLGMPTRMCGARARQPGGPRRRGCARAGWCLRRAGLVRLPAHHREVHDLRAGGRPPSGPGSARRPRGRQRRDRPAGDVADRGPGHLGRPPAARAAALVGRAGQGEVVRL